MKQLKQSFLFSTVPLVATLLVLGLCGGCQHEVPSLAPSPATTASGSGPILSQDHDGGLYFDERYLDSTDTEPEASWSARTQREMAIFTQLKRLRMVNRSPAQPNTTDDSVYEKIGYAPLVGYRNRAAELADIYHKIDSLKVLEHISLTPH